MLNIVKLSQRFSAHYRTILNGNSVKLSHRSPGIVTGFHSSVCCWSKDDDDNSNSKDENVIPKVAPTIASRYELFTEEKASIILDVEEERDKMLAGELDYEEIEDAAPDAFAGLNTERE